MPDERITSVPPPPAIADDKHRDSQECVCWYCCANPATGKPLTLALYRVVSQNTPFLSLTTRFVYNRVQLAVPRCPACEAHHERAATVGRAIVVASVAIGIAVAILAHIYGGPFTVGADILIALMAAFAACLVLLFLCHVGEQLIGDPVPRIPQHLVDAGWREGEGPSRYDVRRR